MYCISKPRLAYRQVWAGPKHRPVSSWKDRCCLLLTRTLHFVFLFCCAYFLGHMLWCKQACLVFPVSCMARYLPYRFEKREEMEPSHFSHMHFCCTSCHMYSSRPGCGVDVGLWWEGGSATALTDFQAPLQNHRKEHPQPTTHPTTPSPSAHCCNGHYSSIHEASTNHSTLRGFQKVVQDVW